MLRFNEILWNGNIPTDSNLQNSCQFDFFGLFEAENSSRSLFYSISLKYKNQHFLFFVDFFAILLVFFTGFSVKFNI